MLAVGTQETRPSPCLRVMFFRGDNLNSHNAISLHLLWLLWGFKPGLGQCVGDRVEVGNNTYDYGEQEYP